MHTVKAILKAKPQWIVLLIFSYILILGILKWRFSPDWSTVLYLFGGVFGVYFMDFAELVFAIRPSPFRSMLFVGLFGVVSFFVVTSSGSSFAVGLVLSLYFTILLLLAEEWQTSRNIGTWFTFTRMYPSVTLQRWCVLAAILLLIIETVLFIR